MKLLIVSGLSGSGKSIVLHVLEDLGYYCIDNLPAGMLPALADQLQQHQDSEHEYFAVGIDARNLTGDLEQFPVILKNLKSRNIHCEVFFLEADDAVLLKRFSETRRRHPLSNDEVPLSEAILQERTLLAAISSTADLIIDTSQTNIHQLRDLIHRRVTSAEHARLSILFESFGYKNGIPANADFIFDIRCIPNPHWVPELRAQTGLDQDVIEYLEQHEEVKRMYSDIRQLLETWIPCFEADNRSYMTVAIGCTGGQHRSVYMVNKLSKFFSQRRDGILTRHRELS
ncbi:MAG: RNase adapter RapZ [Thiohalomonadales bacterium]|nr:RNase adapter RapZ [Thiohalomonadales bacterium]